MNVHDTLSREQITMKTLQAQPSALDLLIRDPDFCDRLVQTHKKRTASRRNAIAAANRAAQVESLQ